MLDSPVNYYAQHSPITDPGEYRALFDGLPPDVPSLVRVVQGVLLHVFWAERYGVRLSEARKAEVGLRHVRHMLARLVEIDDRPLTVAREPEQRLVGNCRDFSVLLCAMLRRQGVPARARCGFGTYFTPGRYEDHWVCEHWDVQEQRWVMVDAQLDALQCATLNIPFDPLDLPSGPFLPAGQAWQMCRAGEADPDTFGIFDMHGLWFVRGDLLRDLAALNKVELLPWDCWGLVEGADEHISEADLVLLDRAAALSLAGDAESAAMRSLYKEHDGLCVPELLPIQTEDGLRLVDLATGAAAP
ncbi:MAG: transglutaminase domain-containing protein [Anaerolineales bacterium]|nr:transglutaminase domain-containing protein [Anaerolineales bacterium]